jgi:hypothetical protein
MNPDDPTVIKNSSSFLKTILEDTTEHTDTAQPQPLHGVLKLRSNKPASVSNFSICTNDSGWNGSASDIAVLGNDDRTLIAANTSENPRHVTPGRRRIYLPDCSGLWTKKNIILCAAAAVLVVGVLSAILAVVVTNKNREENREELNAVDTILSAISAPEQLMNETTPQYKAREWLRNDPLLDYVLEQGPTRLKQRYALAEFYFATDGPNWNISGFLVSNLTECNWTGVTCDPSAEKVFRLFLPEALIHGEMQEELSAIETLQELDFSDNNLFGTIPQSLFESWKRLYWLDLSENQLTGEIPSVLWTMSELKFIYLHSNKLTGMVQRSPAKAISSLPFKVTKSVEEVWLHDNNITGSIPTWFSNLTGLQEFIARNNHLTGSIPEFLPRSINYLDLSTNMLQGRIPESLWLSSESPPLKTLLLDHNKLSGGLPPTTDFPQDFTNVSLHDNELSGSIPDRFGYSWRNIVELKLYNNQLIGRLGPDVNDDELEEECPLVWPFGSKIMADCFERNYGDVPPVQCPCCTDCV